MTAPLSDRPAPPNIAGCAAPRKAEPAAPATPRGAEEQERDVWWGAYSSRAMLPSLLVCILWTVGVVTLAWFHAWIGLSWDTARFLSYGLVAAVWLAQTVRWLYRIAGYTYRLTTRRLFVSQGLLYPPEPAIDLAQIHGVRAEQSPWEHVLGVGQVRIIRGNSTQPPMVLLGVQHPARIAAMIERRMAGRSTTMREPSRAESGDPAPTLPDGRGVKDFEK
jgi:membrane protein YdbS with pleckstrin-like domain